MALNNQQWLICHKTKPTNHPTAHHVVHQHLKDPVYCNTLQDPTRVVSSKDVAVQTLCGLNAFLIYFDFYVSDKPSQVRYAAVKLAIKP